jgi:hypothetical protein
MRLISRTALLVYAVAVTIAACSTPAATLSVATPAAPAATTSSKTPAATPAAPATTSKGLSLDLVKQQVVPVFTKDPDRPKGEWVTDLADLDQNYRPTAKEFAYYDCHVQDNELIPHRIAQAIYVKFADANSANTYADNEGGLAPALIADTTVVMIGSGLSTVNVRQTLRSIESACVCGHVT